MNEELKESMNDEDADGIEIAIDEIDHDIPSDMITPNDKRMHDEARALLKRLRNKPAASTYFFVGCLLLLFIWLDILRFLMNSL